MNILITGGAGFIGSNFILHYLSKYSKDKIINLDLLTYAGNLDNLKALKKCSNYFFIQGDIKDKNLVCDIFNEYKIDAVIHFAAESHVDNSISSPDIFIQTNINGTFNLLHNAYKFWHEKPFVAKRAFQNTLFYHISTDEVFGSLGQKGFFNESSPYAPNSPYSASKASSDMLVRSYAHTYGLNAVITNCSNNYGPYQHDEKLIPTIIRNALANKDIPIYGDGKNIRDWLFVEDHCRAIDKVFHYALKQIENGERFFDSFCIGANEEHENLDIAKTICEILDKKVPKNRSYKEQICFVADRAGHDRRYAINSSKLKKLVNWQVKENLNSGLLKTINFYMQKYEN